MKLTTQQQLKLKFAIDAINDCAEENRETKIDFYSRAITHLKDVISSLEPPKIEEPAQRENRFFCKKINESLLETIKEYEVWNRGGRTPSDVMNKHHAWEDGCTEVVSLTKLCFYRALNDC